MKIERLGLVMEPDGDPLEVEGTLNPASARTRDGALLLYPRVVTTGNVSRVGRVELAPAADRDFRARRDGYALEPETPYELRERPGFGCEDPRVTYIPVLDKYVMAYTGYGAEGPRIAVALSDDAKSWTRLGLVRFEGPGMAAGDDKDAAFFPEPVLSPAGVLSIAFYHRPMFHISAIYDGASIDFVQRLPFEDRESIRIAYVPLEAVLKDPAALLDVAETVRVLSPDEHWGSTKIGGGTPPVRIEEGWFSIFHGVDVIGSTGIRPTFRYSAGLVMHDAREPHKVIYRSPEPLLAPESERERSGIVDNVVFPTAIDPRPDLGPRVFDIFYGMADYSIGAARLTL